MDDLVEVDVVEVTDDGFLRASMRCVNCGKPYRGIEAISIGSKDGDAMLQVPDWTCEFCGHFHPTVGTYESVMVDGEFRAVLHRLDFETLKRIRESLRALQADGDSLDPDHAVEVIARDSPALAVWLRDRDNRRDLMTMINLLLVAVGTLIALMAYNKAPTPTPAQIDKLIIQIDQGSISDPGLPRKAPCWCGSGKRYKACHAELDSGGRPPESEQAGP